MFEAERGVIGQAQKSGAPQPLVMTIRHCNGSVPRVSTAPSRAIFRPKDMDVLKKSVEKDLQEIRQARAARDKKSAKAGKRKTATPSSSSCSFTTSSIEEEEKAEKIKVTKEGAKRSQKAPVKVPSKTQTARKPRGKRPLEDPAQSCHAKTNQEDAESSSTHGVVSFN